MWKTYKLQDLILKTSKVRGIQTKKYQNAGKYPIIDQGSNFIAGYSDDEDSRYKDDLPVVIFGDHTLAIKYVDFDFCAGADGTQILKPNKDIITGKFFYYSIRKLNIQSLGYSRHFKLLKEATFAVPSLEEQKRIVRILDQAEYLRKKRQKAISLLDDYLEAVFLEMFGDPHNNIHDFPIGVIGDLVSEVKYGTSKRAEENGEYIYLRMNNITYKGELDLSALKYINLEDNEKPKYLAKRGDILFNRTNSKELVGKTAVYDLDEPMAIAGYLIRVRVNEKAIPEYISGYLNSKHSKLTLEKMCKNIVGMANINAKELQKIRIIVPPRALQEKYTQIFLKNRALKAVMKKQSYKMDTNFNALMQKAFNSKIN